MEEKENTRKIKIMIADDFPLLVEDLCELIERQEDMEVAGTANSGKKIVELAKNTEFDIILMDIEMENLNAGITATEQLRELLGDISVIFLTVHDTNEMILTAMGAGAVDYLVKGCSEEEILNHIRSAYAGNPIMERKVHDTVMREYVRLQKSEKSLLFFINNLSRLTAAERELIKKLLEGKTVKEIAKERCVETVTIKTQIKGLLRKFGCSRTREVIKMIEDLNITHLFL
ncbi:MAG: response regulator transcription factor [Lachnospiraceae bacterium]|jgi:DNA-binding NarL/FixJ family response regulator|nr:response regulator transcription factor [Lachnospiraceae bacterium]GFI15763.1 transcriptional regulatory protein LiaR [Lachnospiraceae bacterium]